MIDIEFEQEFLEDLERIGLDYRDFWNYFGEDNIPSIENIEKVYNTLRKIGLNEEIKENIDLFEYSPKDIKKAFDYLTQTKGLKKKQALECLGKTLESFAYLTKIMKLSEKQAAKFLDCGIDDIKEQTPQILETVLHELKQ